MTRSTQTPSHADPEPVDPAARRSLGPGAVVVVGGMNMDITAVASQAAQLGDSTPGTVTTAPGGVGRNIAENLARLGLAIELVSAVGDDLQGQQLLDACRRVCVGVQGVQVLAGQTSATYLSVHSNDGQLLHAVNDMAVLEQWKPQGWLGSSAWFQAAPLCLVDANLSPAALAAVLQQCSGKMVFADAVSAAKCTRLLPHLPELHLLKVNRLEACALLSWPLSRLQSPADAHAAAQALVAAGVQNVVLSLGRAGAVWCSTDPSGDQSAGGNAGGNAGRSAGQREGFCPALGVPIKSTTGAGDALMAGLVWGLTQGWALGRALGWGMACAALTLQDTAANNPHLSVQAVEHLLRQVPQTAPE